MALWFSTAIPGQINAQEVRDTIKKGNVTQPIKVAAKAPVVNKQPVAVWRIQPKAKSNWDMFLAVTDIMEGKKPNDQLIQEYWSKLKPEQLKTAINLASDITNGSWLDEIKKAYVDVDTDTIDKSIQAYQLLSEIYWEDMWDEEPVDYWSNEHLSALQKWLIGAGIWGVWSYGVWATIGWIGKAIYWAWLKAAWDTNAFIKEADRIAEQRAFWGKPVKTILDTAMEQPGMFGTPIGVSVDTKKNMDTVWNKKVLPVVDKIDNAWFKMSVGKLEKRVSDKISSIKQIQNVQGYADEIKAAVSEYFWEKMDKGISSWNLKQLQAEKTALRNWIQKRIWAWAIPSDADKLVEKVVADTYNDIIHEELKKQGKAWLEASDAFVDYGNLKAMEWSSKLAAKSPLKGWLLWVVQTAQETIGIPVSTAVGKWMAKAGSLIKEASLIPTLQRFGKKVLSNIKWGLAKWLNPAELIAPDMLVQSYISQGMSEEEATQKAQQLRIQLFELPGKKLNELLDKALWTDKLQPKK